MRLDEPLGERASVGRRLHSRAADEQRFDLGEARGPVDDRADGDELFRKRAPSRPAANAPAMKSAGCRRANCCASPKASRRDTAVSACGTS